MCFLQISKSVQNMEENSNSFLRINLKIFPFLKEVCLQIILVVLHCNHDLVLKLLAFVNFYQIWGLVFFYPFTDPSLPVNALSLPKTFPFINHLLDTGSAVYFHQIEGSIVSRGRQVFVWRMRRNQECLTGVRTFNHIGIFILTIMIHNEPKFNLDW